MIFILQAFLLYSEYEFVKCACFLWILAQHGIGENHPASFDARRAPEQRSPLRNLRSATQSPAIPRGPCLWSSSLQDRETCVLRHEPRKRSLYSVARTPEIPRGCVPPKASLSRHIRFIGLKYLWLILDPFVIEMSRLAQSTLTYYLYSSFINGSLVFSYLSAPGRQCACLVPKPRGGLVLESVSTDPVPPGRETCIL